MTMSEPASHSDIEDVLSSIRRLVSEETRTPLRADKTPDKDENKLVLTPSLRVPDPDPEPATDASGDEPVPQAKKDEPPWAQPGATLFGAASTIAENSNEIDEIILGVEAMLPARKKPVDDLSDAVDLQDDGNWDGRDETAPYRLENSAEDRHDDTGEMDGPLTLERPIVPGTVASQAETKNATEDLSHHVDDEEHDLSCDAPDDAADASFDTADGGNDGSNDRIDEEDQVSHDIDHASHNSTDDLDSASQGENGEEHDTSYDSVVEGDEASFDGDEDHQPDSNDPLDTLSAKIEALEAAVHAKNEHWEPDEPGSGAYAGTEVEAMTWEDAPAQDETSEDPVDDETADEVREDVVLAQAKDDVAEDAGPEADPVLDPEPDISANVEDVREPEAIEAAPEQPELDTPADPAPVMAHDEDAPIPVPEPVQTTDDAPVSMDGDFLAEEALLDEESLREIVTDIVRQELQGALGERITRNVRKLVRREIHRALTAQDFD
ncbi:MAG: hypothetical protein AAGA05_14695 [Pseudomonadota bacterium]